ncbi:hypothetical protein [Aliivibrio fischeri]|uniref:hypothetical protein n=1 Tax=Aliivibrio fischeri TaxID=668 RepID=UPI0007C43E7E|nr:hypothetical protein [Aliivibrio fischeri]
MDILESIYPGELLINLEKVQRYALAMAKGDSFPPPELISVRSYTVVRDGNHRVCAWIQCFEQGIDVPKMFIPSSVELSNKMAIKQFEVIAEMYGSGINGFLSIPRSSSEEYNEKHGKLQQQIYPLICT